MCAILGIYFWRTSLFSQFLWFCYLNDIQSQRQLCQSQWNYTGRRDKNAVSGFQIVTTPVSLLSLTQEPFNLNVISKRPNYHQHVLINSCKGCSRFDPTLFSLSRSGWVIVLISHHSFKWSFTAGRGKR